MITFCEIQTLLFVYLGCFVHSASPEVGIIKGFTVYAHFKSHQRAGGGGGGGGGKLCTHVFNFLLANLYLISKMFDQLNVNLALYFCPHLH